MREKSDLATRDSICGCNSASDEGDDGNTVNTVSSSINVDNIETEGNSTVNSVVRACDTDVLHQNKTDDLIGFSRNS